MKKLAALLLLGAPGALAGQNTTVSSFVAADGGVVGSPVLLGITVGREAGHLGLRWGAGVDARSTLSWSDQASGDGVLGLLSTDVDGMLFLGRADGDLAVNPYLLGGAGLRMVRDISATETAATWSYGAGMRAPVSGRMALQTEARFRNPIAAPADVSTARMSEGWELRAGMHLRFGSLRHAAPPAPSPRPRAIPLGSPARIPLSAPAAGDASDVRHRIAFRTLDVADDYLGTRYTWGGNTPAEGFDCSGFVRYVFRKEGIELPRVSRDQARFGAALPLDLAALEPGDLLAFASDGVEVDHIAIYAGDGRIIHSSSSGNGVRLDDISGARGQWYRNHMVAARRVIQTPWSWPVQ